MELPGRCHVAQPTLALLDRGEPELVSVEGPGAVQILRRQLRYRRTGRQESWLVADLWILGHGGHLSTVARRVSLRASEDSPHKKNRLRTQDIGLVLRGIYPLLRSSENAVNTKFALLRSNLPHAPASRTAQRLEGRRMFRARE